jgi:SAM-dependent methyltransferase
VFEFLTRFGGRGERPFREGQDRFVETYAGFTSRLVVEPATGHMRFHPTPGDDLLARYYNGTFTRSADAPTPEREFTPQLLETIRGLESYLRIEARLGEGFTFHDVGCGFGGSVWAMRHLGVRATGNEANAAWVDAANPHCGGALSSAPLEGVLAGLPHAVDAFFCAHVLEHVPDPLGQLRLMARHLSDEGVAYLCMPNIHSLRTMRRGVRDSAAYFFPMHLNYFTPTSLVAMVRAAGMEPLRIETRSMFDDGATAEDCAALRGWELFVLAGKPGHTRVQRDRDIDAKCARALCGFNAARRAVA